MVNFQGTSINKTQWVALLDLYLNNLPPNVATAAALRRRTLIAENDEGGGIKLKGSWKLSPFGKSVVAEILRNMNLPGHVQARLAITAYELTELLHEKQQPGGISYACVIWADGAFQVVYKKYSQADKTNLQSFYYELGVRWEDARDRLLTLISGH